MAENKENERKDLSSDYLEGFNNASYNYDLSAAGRVMSSTELSELEDWERQQGVPLPMPAVQSENAADSSSGEVFWASLDLPLNDIVKRVFSRSLRPFVIIRDDKVEYVNQALLKMMGLHSRQQMVNRNFLEFVFKDDWNLLAENIGQMLTNDSSVNIRLQRADRKIVNIRLHAVYIPDSEHFSFVLFGEEEQQSASAAVMPVVHETAHVLFDEQTSLPSFYLFEDRVQMAVNAEVYKNVRLPKNLIAVAGVSFKNIDYFQKLNMEDFFLKKMASRLVLGLKKSYTVARGLKCPFWVLFTDIVGADELQIEIQKLMALVQGSIEDNFTTHEVQPCVGLSVFPEPAHSAKQLLQQAVFALARAGETEQDFYRYNKADAEKASE